MSEVFRVKKTKDYTVMSNHHLKNKKLSLKAKGLLSLMLSLPENWNYNIKGLTVLNKDGRDSIISALKELEKEKYIFRHRIRNQKGQLTITEYLISEIPMTEIPIQEKPIQDNPTLDNPIQEKPMQENTTLSNTYQSKTKKSNTNGIKYQSIHQSFNSDTGQNDVENFECVIENVKFQIGYENFIYQNRDISQVDEIVHIIAEVYVSNTDRKIGGCVMPYQIIQNTYRKLNYDCIEYVLDCIEQQSKKNPIRNMKAYLVSTLYNAPFTINNYYSARVNYDMENKNNS